MMLIKGEALYKTKMLLGFGFFNHWNLFSARLNRVFCFVWFGVWIFK